MKEFAEKLIERFKDESVPGFINLNRAIRIANELAEEYKDVSDTNVGKWIPVSERLPEYNPLSEYYEPVIVTLDNGRVVDGCYRNKDEEWWVDAADGEHYSINATGHVLAWQPLPEPYKGE